MSVTTLRIREKVGGVKTRFNAWRKAKGNPSFGQCHYSAIEMCEKNMKARISREPQGFDLKLFKGFFLLRSVCLAQTKMR